MASQGPTKKQRSGGDDDGGGSVPSLDEEDELTTIENAIDVLRERKKEIHKRDHKVEVALKFRRVSRRFISNHWYAIQPDCFLETYNYDSDHESESTFKWATFYNECKKNGFQVYQINLPCEVRSVYAISKTNEYDGPIEARQDEQQDGCEIGESIEDYGHEMDDNKIDTETIIWDYYESKYSFGARLHGGDEHGHGCQLSKDKNGYGVDTIGIPAVIIRRPKASPAAITITPVLSSPPPAAAAAAASVPL